MTEYGAAAGGEPELTPSISARATQHPTSCLPRKSRNNLLRVRHNNWQRGECCCNSQRNRRGIDGLGLEDLPLLGDKDGA